MKFTRDKRDRGLIRGRSKRANRSHGNGHHCFLFIYLFIYFDKINLFL
jgi:hypothetical protein